MPIIFDDAPLERFIYSAKNSTVIFEADTEDEARITLTFIGVISFKFTPSFCFDRSKIYTNDGYNKSLLHVKESVWIEEINKAKVEYGEFKDNDLKHYLIPSDDGIWEIAAHDVQIAI